MDLSFVGIDGPLHFFASFLSYLVFELFFWVHCESSDCFGPSVNRSSGMEQSFNHFPYILDVEYSDSSDCVLWSISLFIPYTVLLMKFHGYPFHWNILKMHSFSCFPTSGVLQSVLALLLRVPMHDVL